MQCKMYTNDNEKDELRFENNISSELFQYSIDWFERLKKCVVVSSYS